MTSEQSVTTFRSILDQIVVLRVPNNYVVVIGGPQTDNIGGLQRDDKYQLLIIAGGLFVRIRTALAVVGLALGVSPAMGEIYNRIAERNREFQGTVGELRLVTLGSVRDVSIALQSAISYVTGEVPAVVSTPKQHKAALGVLLAVTLGLTVFLTVRLG